MSSHRRREEKYLTWLPKYSKTAWWGHQSNLLFILPAICLLNFMSASVMIPRSLLLVSIRDFYLPSYLHESWVYWSLGDFPVGVHTHLAGWKRQESRETWGHRNILSKSTWRVSWSSIWGLQLVSYSMARQYIKGVYINNAPQPTKAAPLSHTDEKIQTGLRISTWYDFRFLVMYKSAWTVGWSSTSGLQTWDRTAWQDNMGGVYINNATHPIKAVPPPCYMDLNGGVPLPKGHFLSPDSLAKDVFLAKISLPSVYFSSKVLSQGYIFWRQSLKIGAK